MKGPVHKEKPFESARGGEGARVRPYIIFHHETKCLSKWFVSFLASLKRTNNKTRGGILITVIENEFFFFRGAVPCRAVPRGGISFYLGRAHGFPCPKFCMQTKAEWAGELGSPRPGTDAVIIILITHIPALEMISESEQASPPSLCAQLSDASLPPRTAPVSSEK